MPPRKIEDLPLLPRLRSQHYLIFDPILLLVYTLIVHGWTVFVHPLGRDYAVMAAKGESLPFLADRLFAWEMTAFGANPVPYHIVNILALYACTVCIFFLGNYAVRGHFWFGTWAGVVFMANPIHSESVLNLSGIGDLLPALFALLALALYGSQAHRPRPWKMPLAYAAFVLAVIPYPQHVLLFVAVILYEVLVTKPENRGFRRLPLYVAIGVVGLVIHFDTLNFRSFDLAPLYFVFYPIGFLPETAARFHAQPWIGWVAALAVVIGLLLVYRKARRPSILFAVGTMILLRCFVPSGHIDPVHVIGGGQLVLASALMAIAMAALGYRCMDHPKWKKPMVGITTVFAIGAVLVQVRSNLTWAEAGRYVQAFQDNAERISRELEGAPVGILPDWQYFRGAPVSLSASISHETPFSVVVPHKSVALLNTPTLDPEHMRIESWSGNSGVVTFDEGTPLMYAPWPYDLARPNGRSIANGGAVTQQLSKPADDGVRLTIRSEHPLPPVHIPLASSGGEEAGEQSETGAGDEQPSEEDG